MTLSHSELITQELSYFGFFCEVLTASEPPKLKHNSKKWVSRLYNESEVFSEKILKSFALSDEMTKDLTPKEKKEMLSKLKTSYWKEAGKTIDKFNLEPSDCCNLIIQQYENTQTKLCKDLCRTMYNLALKGSTILGNSETDTKDVYSKINLTVKVVN